MKKEILIKCQNGIDLESARRDIFFELAEDYHFIETERPDFILFGPYGNQVPQKGNYVRIGYFCENMRPDMNSCEWAFGVPAESQVNNLRYSRIQWHGIRPADLLKDDHQDIERIMNNHTRFCNFLYSTPVPYREEFFRQLSKYKRVDAPGRAMNNMPSIDTVYKGDVWQRKRTFLSQYKFTVAFENYSYPGYQTEKLYDPMRVNSLPVYCGDPLVTDIFNSRSFIFASEHMNVQESPALRWLEDASQPDFKDMRPQFFHSPADRAKRKLKIMGRKLKMRLQFNNLDFSPVIDRIIAADKNPEIYADYLRQPWFPQNRIPSACSSKERWKQIFDHQDSKLNI